MWKAVVVDKDYGSLSPDILSKMQKSFQEDDIELRLERYTTSEQIIMGCQDADAILGIGNPPIVREVIASLPRLKFVQRFGIGVNSIDLVAATEHGVMVLYMPGFCTAEIAVHATALILNLVRNVGLYDRGIRRGEWPKATGPLPRNPGDLTLGLYGFGASARELYKIFALGYGSPILVHDPYFTPDKQAAWQAEFVDFDTMIARSDIISIHAPLTAETRHVFDRDVFRKMKPTAMLINVARGELVNLADLVEALAGGELAFAGLDVFEKEPIQADNPLLAMENVVLTPHSAFYGHTAQKNQITLAIELVKGALKDNRIPRRYIANQDVIGKLRDLEVF